MPDENCVAFGFYHIAAYSVRVKRYFSSTGIAEIDGPRGARVDRKISVPFPHFALPSLRNVRRTLLH
jgi:hypothetical protein